MTIDDEPYVTTLQQLRRARAAAIAAERSWLALAGLLWLQPGDNSFGTGATNALVLPGTQGPEQAGTFTLANGVTTVHAAPGVALQVNGEPISERVLQHDMAGAPDVVTLGELSLIVIKRGERYGIRLYNNASPMRQAFTHLDWYEIDPAYRIEARFVTYEPARTIAYDNVLGDTTVEQSPGAIEFTWDGVTCRLDALPRGDKLFFNFRDATNGSTTYGAGRFLYTDGPKEGIVIVDFNQATNPYCAYTLYATCPLPPAQNQLSVRIAAGERKFPQPLVP